MWVKITRIILRNRVAFLTGLIIVTLFMGYKGSQIKLSYDFSQIIPTDNPKYIEYEEYKEIFGQDGNILVIGIQSEKLFSYGMYNDWYELGNKIKEIEGIEQVISVAHAYNLVKDDSTRKLLLKPITSRPAFSQNEVDSLKELFLSLPFYKGLIHNEATNASMMAISINETYLNTKKRIGVVKSITDLGDEFADRHQTVVHYSGLPFIRTVVATTVVDELKLFLIIAFLTTAIILFILFRSLYMVLFPMLVVMIGVIWSLGTIVLLGYEITILTGLIPSLIVVIGIANCIYLLNRYHSEYKKHGNKIKALSRVIERIGVAAFYTNLTTAIGFGVFTFTNSRILIEFGVVSGLNIMSVFLISLIFIPIVFSFLPNPSHVQTRYLENKMMEGILSVVNYWIREQRATVYVITITLIILGIVGINRIKSTGYIVEEFPKNTKEHVDLVFLEKNFGGVLPFEIVMDSKKKGGAFRLSTIREMDKVQDVLVEFDEFSRPISLVEGLKFVTQAYFNGNPNKYRLPNDMEKTFILPYLSKVEGKGGLLSNFTDSTQQFARISAQMLDVGSAKLPGLLSDLKTKIHGVIDSTQFNITFTGISIIFLEGNSYLIKSLINSLLIAFVFIAIIMALLYRSVKMLLISLIPNIIPLLITAGIMGFFNIALKPSTVLIFSIAFGIAIDTSIHFLTKYRQEIRRHEWDVSKTITVSLESTGRSMIYTSLVLFFGFVIFSFSSFGGTVALGTLTSITLIVALFTNLIVLPTLLLSMESSSSKAKAALIVPQVYDESDDIEIEKLILK